MSTVRFINICILLILPFPLWAQSLLTGYVRSETGYVAKASVLVTGNGVKQTAISDEVGYFSMPAPAAGTYKIKISAVGFHALEQNVAIKTGTAEFTFSLQREYTTLNEVAVNSNPYRKEDDLIDIKKVAQPVTIINKKTIKLMGSRRLDEVLREQTGMAMVSDLGSGNRSVGLQMQGFGSEYILIMINGQPMTGRFNGNFDLSRISVSDIERIEIIKGASSSLYGCEAIGGVINIITRQQVNGRQATASIQYGTFNTLDALLEGETAFAGQKGSAYLSANYYQTDGFNVNTQYLQQGQTGPPYNSLNLQGRFSYQLNERNTLQASGRYAGRNSLMERSYGVQQFDDELDENDINASLSLNSRMHNGTRLLSRYYLTRYATDQQVTFRDNGHSLQSNRFTQTIQRLELQAVRDLLDKKLSLTGGVGGDYQRMNNQADVSLNDMYNYFGYLQANYQPNTKYNVVLGVRYDGNNVYGGKLNPTIGAGYQPARWLKMKFSAGQGFKAPTYAQMYQVFTNMMQGYTVIGANVFAEKAAEMKNNGTVLSLWAVSNDIRDLQPETSTSFNLDVTVLPFKKLELNVNGFYNSLKNQIFNQQVGLMANSQALYSFFNVERSYTTGLEATVKWTPLKGLAASAGYQYLIAKDKGVEDSIAAGKGRYATVRADGGIRAATTTDYFNLPNRSRHSANFQVFYDYQPWALGISVRGTFRGKYGFMDQDNNGYIDPYDVFVDGYFLGYASVQKKLLQQRLTLQLSVDNIFDYTDALMPAQPGRTVMAGVTWRFSSKKQNP